jgi:hypothetical protein
VQSLHFQERSLKPYAEPVSIGELKEGEVYFTIQFAGSDRDGLFPIMETLVFVGSNLDEDDVDRRVYFQDIESYQAGVRYRTSTADDGAVFYAQDPQYLNHIFEYENALNELLKCSLRRTGVRG